MTVLVSTPVPQYITSVQAKSRTRTRNQSMSPLSPSCRAAHYQTPPKLDPPRISSPTLTPSPLRRRLLFPAGTKQEVDELENDDNDIFLQSPFKFPVHRLHSYPKPTKSSKPVTVDDDEAALFLSSSSAAPSSFLPTTSTKPLYTPVKDSHRNILAAKQLNSQPAHRVGVGTKRKSAQSSGGDFSTPLRPVPSATCTPLNISAPKPDPSSGVAFHRLAPLPAPRFTPQPKSKAEADAFLKRQAETMKRLRIRDMHDSDEDWGIVEHGESDEECVQRLPALRKSRSQSVSPKKPFLIKVAQLPQKGSPQDEVTEAISPGGHIIKRRARSRPVSLELLESVKQTPSPKVECSSRKPLAIPVAFPSVSRDRSRPSSFVGPSSPVPRRRVTGSSGPNPFVPNPPSRPGLQSQSQCGARPFNRLASNSSASVFFGPSIPQSAQPPRTRTNSSVASTLELRPQSQLSTSNRHSYAGPGTVGLSGAPTPWMMRSGLETPSPQTSPLNDGPGTVYSDDEDMFFDGPPETSFVFSVTEDTPSPRSHKAQEGRFPSKYKQRDSGIVLSDDESIRVRNSTLSTSSSSMYSDNDNTDDLITPGIMPGAQSGWPRISGLDDLHSFTQSHLHQYFGHDEDNVDAFILRTLEACGKPSATESKKPPGTPVKKLKGHFGLDGGRPWQSAVASKIGFSFDGADGAKGDKKKPRKSLPAAFPPPLGRGSTGADKAGGSDTEEDEDATSPSSRKQYKGLGLGRPAGRWLMRRSSSGAFSSEESAGGTPTRRNVNFKDWPMPAARTLTVDSTSSRSSSNSSTISVNSPTIARHPPSKPGVTHSHSPLGPRIRKMSVVEHVRTVSDAGRFEKEFVEIEQVGSGEFGRVMKVRAKLGRGVQDTDTVWAVKRSKPFEGSRHRLRLREEVDILAHLSARGAHPNVLTYVDSWEQDDALFIRTELCELGNFARFLWEYGRTFPRLDEARVWKIMVDLSNGLRFIHEAGIIHLDLKPANIFLTREGRFKIGDFGMASVWPRPGGAFEREGDKLYLARELLQGTYGKAADIFSFGMTMLETATNIVVPDQGDGWHRLRQEDFSQMDLDGSPELFALIKSMMRMDPARRIDVQAVCAHPVVGRARAAMERTYEECKREGVSVFSASPLAGVPGTFLEKILGRSVMLSYDCDAMDLSP